MEKLVTCVTDTGEQSIKNVAQVKHDFSMLGRIEGIDQRAKEARYHESCHRSYVRSDIQQQHSCQGSVDDMQSTNTRPKEQKEAYLNAFQYYIQQSIICDENVERMIMLREKYMEFMRQHSPQYYNDNYRTSKLKE